MKIVSKGSVLNSSEFYRKKQRRRRIRSIIFLSLFILVFSALISLLRYDRLQISGIVLDNTVVGGSEIVSEVEAILDGNYLWIIPKRNSLFYPEDLVKERLFERFPRFKSIELNLDRLHILNIETEERSQSALYCEDTWKPTNESACYFLDEEGFIFALAPSFSDGIYFIYTSEDPIESPLGKSILEPVEFKTLSEFIKSLETVGIYPAALKVSDVEYALMLSNSGEILWKKGDDYNLVRSNLETFLTSDSIRSLNNFLNRVLYLDLRTENKVFYKLRD